MKTFYLNLNNFSLKNPNKRVVKTQYKNDPPPLLYHVSLPACKDCMYSVNNPPNSDLMVCTLFKYRFAPITYDYTHYVETQICRLDEDLCGSDGRYFKKIKD